MAIPLLGALAGGGGGGGAAGMLGGMLGAQQQQSANTQIGAQPGQGRDRPGGPRGIRRGLLNALGQEQGLGNLGNNYENYVAKRRQGAALGQGYAKGLGWNRAGTSMGGGGGMPPLGTLGGGG